MTIKIIMMILDFDFFLPTGAISAIISAEGLSPVTIGCYCSTQSACREGLPATVVHNVTETLPTRIDPIPAERMKTLWRYRDGHDHAILLTETEETL